MRNNRFGRLWPFVLAALAGLLAIMLAQAQGPAPRSEPSLVPPPEPAVRPEIARATDIDTNGDRIDDILTGQLAELRRAIATEPDPEQRAALINGLNEPVGCELVFSRQVTQGQIDRFLALGGRITRIYQAVSYGWNGTIPWDALEQVPAAMGDSFVCAVRFVPVVAHLDEATRSGRVRPIWAAGFAGGTGFSGSSTTTIAILDTGVDDSHTDLSGRMEYWHDHTADAEPNPVDYRGHGSHVAGIATGTGGAAGVNPSTLYWTDSGDLNGVTIGNFYPAPITATVATSSWTGTAYWTGGGTATLAWAYRNRALETGWTELGSTSGSTGVTKTVGFSGLTTRNFSAVLPSNGAATRYAITNQVTTTGIGDGYNLLRGVARTCRWAGLKIFENDGSGTSAEMGAALDDLVVQKTAHSIKVANLSASISGTLSTLRAKANTVVDNGIVLCVSAGNEGPSTVVSDPARAAKVVTVGAVGDTVRLTEYTSTGISSPGTTEDYKPDVLAPGGSTRQSYIMAVDSNDSDAAYTSFADKRANDYTGKMGTSMAAPFAAGCAALVIQALESTGTTWDWTSNSTSLLVKMLLCASATETNASREGAVNSPTTGRATMPHDIYEGFGMVNPDAACEAACMSVTYGAAISDTSAGGYYDRRAWGRKIRLPNGCLVTLNLTMAATADYDLYLYSGTPDSKGKPVILASSCSSTLGATETIAYTSPDIEYAYVFVKRNSGSGTFTLTPTLTPPGTITVTYPNGSEALDRGGIVNITWTYTGSPGSQVEIMLYRGGSYVDDIAFGVSTGSGGVGSYSWTIPDDAVIASNYAVVVHSLSAEVFDISDGSFSIGQAATTLAASDKSGGIGQAVYLNATLTRQDDGRGIAGKTVSFTVAGTGVGSDVTDASGVASVLYRIEEPLGLGSKVISAAYAGGGIYLSSGDDAWLTVSKGPTRLVALNREGAFGDTIQLRATLTRKGDDAVLAGRSVSFRVAGTPVGSDSTDAQGVAMLDWVIPEEVGYGRSPILASFAGDVLYESTSDTSALMVSKADTALTAVDASGVYGAAVKLKATIIRTTDGVQLAGKEITFAVDGTAAGSATSGGTGIAWTAYIIPETLTAGANRIDAAFAGDDLYNAGSDTATLTVEKYAATLVAAPQTGVVGESVLISAVLTRTSDGAAVAYQMIYFTLDGTPVSQIATNPLGGASVWCSIPEGVGEGTRIIGAEFRGSSLYLPADDTAVLTVGKAYTTQYTIDRTSTVTENVILRQYDLRRTTENAVLSGKTIVYKIDGTQVGTATTDAGGDSNLVWTVPAGAATRTIRTEYAGSAAYLPSSATATLTTVVWGTKMAGFDRTARITQRTELKARLLRSDNVPLANKSIDFSVDGTFVITRPTDATGYAKYAYYDVPDGTGAGARTILSSWVGNAGYLACSKTATLTVLPALPYIWVQPKTAAVGSKVSFYAYFRRLYDYQKQPGKTVTFRVDGTAVQTLATDANGVARYLYQTVEPAGDHTMRCEFAGDAFVEAGYGEGLLRLY